MKNFFQFSKGKTRNLVIYCGIMTGGQLERLGTDEKTRDRLGTDLGQARDRLGTDSGQTWNRFGTDLGQTWDIFGTDLGQTWDSLGTGP